MLWDGHPDLTGIWTGIGFTGRAPDILPWAQKIIDDRFLNDLAEMIGELTDAQKNVLALLT